MASQYSSDSNRQPIGANPSRLPLVRISDFFVLTAAMAIVFMLHEELYRVKQGLGFGEDVNRISYFVRRMVSAIPTGIGLASIYWLIEQKWRTGQFFQQPGHWILFASVLRSVALLGAYSYLLDLEGGVGNQDLKFFLKFFGVMGALEFSAFGFLFAAMFRANFAWRWPLGLLAFTYFVNAVLYFATMFNLESILTGGNGAAWVNVLQQNFWIVTTAFSIVGVLLLLYAILSDRGERISRDWLHWAGLAVFFFEFVVEPIMSAVMMYFLVEP